MRENTSYYAILGILSLRDSSGYDIKKIIQSSIGYFYKISNGQIYPILKKLVLQKNASYSVEKDEGKPYRKVYSITEQGLRTLKEWLDRKDYQYDNELLLKLFFGCIQPVSSNIQLINEFKSAKEKKLALYNSIAEYYNLSSMDNLHLYFSYFTVRFGQLVTKARIEWSNEVIEILKDLEKKSK